MNCFLYDLQKKDKTGFNSSVGFMLIKIDIKLQKFIEKVMKKILFNFKKNNNFFQNFNVFREWCDLYLTSTIYDSLDKKCPFY